MQKPLAAFAHCNSFINRADDQTSSRGCESGLSRRAEITLTFDFIFFPHPSSDDFEKILVYLDKVRFFQSPPPRLREKIFLQMSKLFWLGSLNLYPYDNYCLSMQEVDTRGAEVAVLLILEIARLIRLQAFSYLIANGNMHAKNISLVCHPDAEIVDLSPAYDLLSAFMIRAVQTSSRNSDWSRYWFLPSALTLEPPWPLRTVRSFTRSHLLPQSALPGPRTEQHTPFLEVS